MRLYTDVSRLKKSVKMTKSPKPCGLGDFMRETCVNSVNSALASGVLLINTASAYGNKEEVGQASRKTINEGIIEKNCIFSIFHSTYKLVLAINVFCPFVAYHPHISAAGVRLHVIGVGAQSSIHVPRRGIP